MKDLGLNVQKFVTFQTAFVVKDNPDKSSGYPAEAKFKLLTDGGEAHEMGKRIIPGFCGRDADIDKADEQLIRSFEWFLLVDGLWSETFETGVLLYKRFFSRSSSSS
jgi:nuclear pore complex protein Nup107